VRKIFPILFLVFSCSSNAQYGNQHTITIPLSESQNAIALIHLPDDYDKNTVTQHPLIVGFPGAEEYGKDAAKLTGVGLGHTIYSNEWDGNAVNPKTGNTEKFIAISILPPGYHSGFSFSQIDYALTWIYAHYRVDTTCVALTGLSRGAGPVIYYASHISYVNYTNHFIYEYSSPSHKLAAIIPMSAEINQNDPVNFLVDDSVHVWAFGSDTSKGPNDLHGLFTHYFAKHVNNIAPLARFTNYVGGHCCWYKFYNASYKEVIDGISMNIYQFILYHRRNK
jgi:hypothetical protein